MHGSNVKIDHSYKKNQNETYFDLLRLARVTDTSNYLSQESDDAIYALNQLPYYVEQHKRIIPLLNAKAHKLGIFTQLNKQVQQLLARETQNGVITELAKKQQLSIIVDALSSANIPIILLKGAAFWNVLYSAEAPRTSSDLDVLIKKQDWQQAVFTIKSVMNYIAKPKPDVFGDLYELSFIPKSKVGAALDLHNALIHPLLFSINEQELWKSSLVHPAYNNEQIRILSPEHALIHQALHAYKDMDFAKYNLLDSHEIIATLKPDMNKVIDIVKKWGATTPLHVLLANCKTLMKSNLEQHLFDRVKPNILTRLSIGKLLRSTSTKPINNNKSIGYRFNQILSQFVFTGSLIRPVRVQWLFLITLIKLNSRT